MLLAGKRLCVSRLQVINRCLRMAWSRVSLTATAAIIEGQIDCDCGHRSCTSQEVDHRNILGWISGSDAMQIISFTCCRTSSRSILALPIFPTTSLPYTCFMLLRHTTSLILETSRITYSGLPSFTSWTVTFQANGEDFVSRTLGHRHASRANPKNLLQWHTD